MNFEELRVTSGIFLSAAVSLGLLLGLMLAQSPVFGIDIPNSRSLHQHVIRRGGGAGIIIGSWVGWTMMQSYPIALWLCSLGLFLVSWIDDRHRISIFPRLTIQILLASFFVFSIFGLSIFAIFVLFALLWGTNLFNFMDGADGLAAAMAIIGFGSYAIAANFGGDDSIFLICICIVVSAGPFLIFNFPPARIFMGDVGSIPLGFLAGAVGLLGWQRDLWPAWFPIMVFSPFVLDATVTLIRRIINGEKFWLPHKNHYYQRYLLSGAGHKKTFVAAFFLMLGCGFSALSYLFFSGSVQLIVAAVLAAVYGSIAYSIDCRWKKLQYETSQK